MPSTAKRLGRSLSTLQPRPRLLDLHRLRVPLREDDKGRTTGLPGDVRDGQVAVDHALARIHEYERHVGAGRGLAPAGLRGQLRSSPGRSPLRIAPRVAPGRPDRITRPRPSSAFRSADLPTFGRPRIATRTASS